jgi:predicted tellurium resistance membrane protein TerC
MDSFITLMSDPTVWIALITLVVMEVVLGIDNLIFISILSNKLPVEQRAKARRLGITGALAMRLLLLGTIAWIVKLTTPLFTAFGHGVSWRDIILIAGGLFLIWKATKEMHHSLSPGAEDGVMDTSPLKLTMAAAVTQILLLDLVFSIDSIITAVGMTPHVPIMVIAVLVSVSVMLFAATPLSNFVAKHPTVVMLALSFLVLIGATLIAEGFGAHVPKGYIYFAMAFSAGVEGLNIFARSRNERRKQRNG